VNEFEIRVATLDIGKTFEWCEAAPAGPVGPLVVSSQRTFQTDHILMPIGSKVHELRTRAGMDRFGFGGEHFDWREPRLCDHVCVFSNLISGTQVTFVENRSSLLGKDARRSFAIKVQPTVV